MKKEPFPYLRKLIISVVLSILQLFFWIEMLIGLILAFKWYENPQLFRKNHQLESLLFLLILALITFLLKRNIRRRIF
ncbi:hypothetical protein [Pseudarcicella hirudinis]|uniref:hypothetical protein n=1 Tax=Pseudarcicella hirudinis TaxID=1079859 RepID=UPI000B80ED24|nr:hypothetical protein [Pseudarcicella hirudinis]